MQDPEYLLKIWAEHFGKLAESRLGDISDGAEQREKMSELELQSHKNEEYLLDVPFTTEEVSRAVSKLKKKKAPGPDGLLAEHLRAGGEAVVIWLMNILNATVELESVPTVLKRGVVVPVYKGGGKDHTHLHGSKGIGISSVAVPRVGFLGGWPAAYQPVCLQAFCSVCYARNCCQVSQGGESGIYVFV